MGPVKVNAAVKVRLLWRASYALCTEFKAASVIQSLWNSCHMWGALREHHAKP